MNRWIRSSNALVFSAAVTGIFILITIMINVIPNMQFDLTADNKYTLSDNTLSVLDKLEEDVQIYAFTGGNSVTDLQITDMLTEYARNSNNITFDQVNPVKNPSLAQELGVEAYGTVVFKIGDEEHLVPSYQMFTQGRSQNSYIFMGEERFTRILNNSISDEEFPVYLLTGHNEMTSLELATFYRYLSDERYVPQELNLGVEGQVPDDAALLMILGMKQDITEEEAKLITDYLDSGGKLFVAQNFHPEAGEWVNISTILSDYGIAPVSGIVVDPERRFMNNQSITAPLYGFHTIVNELYENNRFTILPTPIPLNKTDETPKGLSLRVLLKTSEAAYAKVEGQQKATSWLKQDGDLEGPFTLAYAVETEESRIPQAVIVGNATFLAEKVINLQGNRDFLMNSLAWLTDKESEISIRAREEKLAPQAFLMPVDVKRIFYSTIMGIPGLFILLGGIVWWRRRKG